MRYLLIFFFFLMYAGDNVGFDISLGPGMSTKNLLLYLVFAGIAVNAAVARNRSIELTSALATFVVLILYAFITWLTLAFVLQDPEYQIKGGFVALKSALVDQFLTLIIFFYGLLHMKDAMWLLRAMIWVVIIGNVITVVDTMNIPDLGVLPVPEKQGRFEGFIGQPNAYGQFLVLFLPACITIALQSRGMPRLLAGIGTFASLLALILTASRGAYVGFIGGAIVAAFYMRRYIAVQAVARAGVVAAIAAIVVLAVTFTMGYAELYLDRFSSIEGNAHVATSGRSSSWSNAIGSMMENPVSFITGYGFHSYDSSRSFRLATHNMYLSYLYNLGLVGLFLFVMVFSRILSAARAAIGGASAELRAHLVAFTFGLVGFLVAIFFSDYHKSGYLLWAYVGVMMRAVMILRSSDATEPAAAEFEQRPPQWAVKQGPATTGAPQRAR